MEDVRQASSPILCRPKDPFSRSIQLLSQSQNMFVKTLIFLAAAATLALADHKVCDWTLFMSAVGRLSQLSGHRLQLL